MGILIIIFLVNFALLGFSFSTRLGPSFEFSVGYKLGIVEKPDDMIIFILDVSNNFEVSGVL